MRPPNMADVDFIHSLYEQWPVTPSQPPVTREAVIRWLVRWMNKRGGEQALIDDVGLIQWRQNFVVAVIDNIVVHPLHQGKGHAKQMMRYLQDRLVAEGVVVASFQALPGPIADMTLKGRFEQWGEGIGEKTGLPTVIGLVRAETEI